MESEEIDIKTTNKKLELLELRVKVLEDMNIALLKERIEKVETNQYMLKDTFSSEEAALYLNISQSSLYKLTSKLQIPHYKPRGKMVYFDKKELIKWMKQNHVKVKGKGNGAKDESEEPITQPD